MLLSVIPLQAYALMGNAQDTSVLLFAVSVGGIIAALTLPVLIRRIGLYPAYLFSCAMMILSAALMMVDQIWFDRVDDSVDDFLARSITADNVVVLISI